MKGQQVHPDTRAQPNMMMDVPNLTQNKNKIIESFISVGIPLTWPNSSKRLQSGVHSTKIPKLDLHTKGTRIKEGDGPYGRPSWKHTSHLLHYILRCVLFIIMSCAVSREVTVVTCTIATVTQKHGHNY